MPLELPCKEALSQHKASIKGNFQNSVTKNSCLTSWLLCQSYWSASKGFLLSIIAWFKYQVLRYLEWTTPINLYSVKNQGNETFHFMESAGCPEETPREKETQLSREVRDNIVMLCSCHKPQPFFPVSSRTNKYRHTLELSRIGTYAFWSWSNRALLCDICHFLIPFPSLQQNCAMCHKKLTVCLGCYF